MVGTPSTAPAIRLIAQKFGIPKVDIPKHVFRDRHGDVEQENESKMFWQGILEIDRASPKRRGVSPGTHLPEALSLACPDASLPPRGLNQIMHRPEWEADFIREREEAVRREAMEALEKVKSRGRKKMKMPKGTKVRKMDRERFRS